MREMMLLGSYFIVPSCARVTVLALRKGIRDGGNVLSGESQHLRKGETCKESGNKPQCSFRYAGVAHTVVLHLKLGQGTSAVGNVGNAGESVHIDREGRLYCPT